LVTPALIRPAKGNRNLQVVLGDRYYEVDERLNFTALPEPKEVSDIRPALELRPELSTDAASVVITDGNGDRWRLPRTDAVFDKPFAGGWPRGVREVASERNLANFHGIFYEIPRSSDSKSVEHQKIDYRRMKPVAAHRLPILDFCSWRGLLVMSGEFAPPSVGRLFRSADGKAALVLRFDPKDGIAKQTKVTFGVFDGDDALIQGLAPDAKVITAGAGLVADGQKVRVIDRASIGQAK
jgi:hypothetical protein